MKNKPFYEKFTKPRYDSTHTVHTKLKQSAVPQTISHNAPHTHAAHTTSHNVRHTTSHNVRHTTSHNVPHTAMLSENCSECRCRIKTTPPIKSEKYGYGKPVFSPLSVQSRQILDAFPDILQRVLPLSDKQMQKLPLYIHALFHELTDDRSRRKIHYMNDPVKLSAYMHYYLWWNLVRMVKLLQNIPIDLPDSAVAADFGSGPLTFLCALWIAKPALRKKKLKWYCVDLSHKALSLGEELFLALCAYTAAADSCSYTPWEIKKVTGAFGCQLKEKAVLITEANMFNEIFWDTPLSMELLAKRTYHTLARCLQPNGSVLLIEPGIPLSGAFISLLRTQFLKGGFSIPTPCPHVHSCALPYSRTPYIQKNIPSAALKWCHFTFETNDSPRNLRRLSEAAHLGKERASLSFLYCTQPLSDIKEQSIEEHIPVRICSDILNLPVRKIGRYACSEHGFLLLCSADIPASSLHTAVSGTLLLVPLSCFRLDKKDKKTGAWIIEIG